MFILALIVFALARVTGNPADLLLPEDASAEDRAHLLRALGLDRPLPEQLVTFLGGAVRGDTRGGVLPPSTPGGCAGTGGVTPSLGWMGGPARLTLPGPFGAHVSGALPGAASLLIIGVNNGAPFPLDLQLFFGGTGPCILLNDFPIVVPGSIAAAGINAGHGHHVFPSLAGASVGGTLFLQEAVFPDPASPLGAPVVLSNSLTITIQP
ncbi:MAG: hypothetical protein ACREIU_11365 [Planctomycetota bacterium]